MIDNSGNPARNAVAVGSAAVLGSLLLQTAGGAFAKQLFPILGVHGLTGLRIGLAACVLLGMRRPWRRLPPRSQVANLIGYGSLMGLMNVLHYHAFARLPIGIATAIEVVGPLAIVLAGSRRPTDFGWLLIAMVGLGMLLPIGGSAALDPVGAACAAGVAACWALYIVLGKRVSATVGRDAPAWGALAAAVLFVPVGLSSLNVSLLTLPLLAAALAVAVLSSVLPYSLEMEAMRRLPSHVFGIFVSTSPAVAALAGVIMLGETLDFRQSIAMLLIVIASIGCAVSSSSSRKSARKISVRTTALTFIGITKRFSWR